MYELNAQLEPMGFVDMVLRLFRVHYASVRASKALECVWVLVALLEHCEPVAAHSYAFETHSHRWAHNHRALVSLLRGEEHRRTKLALTLRSSPASQNKLGESHTKVTAVGEEGGNGSRAARRRHQGPRY